MKKTASLKLNTDGTLTVRAGGAVEHITVDGKTQAELWDAARWSLISKDVSLSDQTLQDLLNKALGK